MIFLLFAVSVANVVITNEIPKEIKNPLVWKKKEIVVSDEFAEICSENEKYLDESIPALEKCVQSDEDSFFEPCAQCLFILAKPEQAHFYFGVQDRMPPYLIRNEEDKNELELALRKKIGNRLVEKLEKQGYLLHSGRKRLAIVQEKMRNEIDLSQFNAQLPDILADVCKQSRNGLVKDRCKQIQKMFHWKETRLRGEYSPFIPKSARDQFLCGTAVIDQDDLKKNVTGLCNHLQLSEQTTSQLVQLTMDGYNGNGKCEKGPVLDMQSEQAQWGLEKDQRKRENIAKLIRKGLEDNLPSDAISSSLYMLRSFTPECRRLDEWESKHGKLFCHAEPIKQMRVACENTPECQAHDNWIRIQELQSIIDKTDSESEKKKLQEEQREIAMKLLGKN